jgi:hypothetical protein
MVLLQPLLKLQLTTPPPTNGSFTLEASFCGASAGRWAGEHFNTQHLELMGAAVCTALLDYWDPLGYGLEELQQQLEWMHPANGDAASRMVQVRPLPAAPRYNCSWCWVVHTDKGGDPATEV